MASKRHPKQKDVVVEILETLLIIELAKCGVPQPDVRKIVGCDMNRVSRIVKLLGLERARGKGKRGNS
jgi:hypothetical protein